MDLGLSGKIVLVTGGSKGIGLATAKAFAEEGARVIIASRSAENLAQAGTSLAEAGANVTLLQADFTRSEDAVRCVADAERLVGPIDVLVNSAGAAVGMGPEKIDENVWRSAFDAKFMTYANAQDAVLASLRRRAEAAQSAGPPIQHGAIVNIVGMGGRVPAANNIAGSAANAGLLVATLGLARHYARYGIRINAINPGITHTDRIEQTLQIEASRLGLPRDEVLARKEAETPLKRYGSPEEIANVALFLASEKASYVVGALVAADGGQFTVF